MVVTPAFTARWVPARLTPAAVSVSTAPPRVVVPLPAVWTSAPALIALAVTSWALVTVRVPRRPLAAPPTTPVKPTSPLPATTVRLLPSLASELSVPPKLTALLVVVTVTPVSSSTASL